MTVYRLMNCPCCGGYHDKGTRMGNYMAEHQRMLEEPYNPDDYESGGERGTPTMDASDPPTEE